jgi:hypothetical protein
MNILLNVEDFKFNIGDCIKFANRCTVEVYDTEVYANFSLKNIKSKVESIEYSYILVVQESYCDNLAPSDILVFSDCQLLDNEGEKVEYTGKRFEPKNYIKK